MANHTEMIVLNGDDAQEILRVMRLSGQSAHRVEASTDEEMLALWLDRYRSERTKEAYATDVREFRAFVGIELRALKLRNILDYSDHLESRNLAPATIRRRLASLRSLIGFAHRLGYLAFDIGAAVQLPAIKDTLLERIMTEDQIDRLFSAVHRPRDVALLRLIYGTGLRISEVAGLKWRDLSLVAGMEGGQITVFGKGGKTRHVPIPRLQWVRVQWLRGEARPDEPVFKSTRPGGGHLGKRAIHDIVKDAARRANLDPNISTHWLRHAHVSHALDHGAPIHVVRATVGHASLETTSKYSHIKPNESSANYIPER